MVYPWCQCRECIWLAFKKQDAGFPISLPNTAVDPDWIHPIRLAALVLTNDVSAQARPPETP